MRPPRVAPIGPLLAAVAGVLCARARGELADALTPPDDFDAAAARPPAAAGGPRPQEDEEDAWDAPRAPRRPSPEKVAALEAHMVERRASASHKIMQQFMHAFSRNMRYAILADSKGDMPEAERQRMLRQLRENGAAPPDQDAAAAEMAARQPPPERHFMHRRSHAHHHPRETLSMLNGRHHAREAAAGRASSAEGGGMMLNRHAGHHRQAAAQHQHQHHSEHERERHFDSLVERLNACKTKECVRALWSEASGGQGHSASPGPAAAETAFAAFAPQSPQPARRRAAAPHTTTPPLLLFGGAEEVATAGGGQSQSQSLRRRDEAPDAGHAGIVGAAIGATVALGAFLVASWLGP